MSEISHEDRGDKWIPFEVEKDFSREGVIAQWADDHPAHWGAEDHLIPHDSAVSSACLSPDERLLAVRTREAVNIYSVDDYSLRQVLKAPADKYTSLEWRPGQKNPGNYWVLSGSQQRTEKAAPQAMLWELDGAGRREENGHEFVIEGASFAFGSKAFSHSGDDILLSFADFPHSPKTDSATYAVDVWNTSISKRRMRLEGHTKSIVWAGFSPNDEIIASSSFDKTLKLWSSATGNLLHSLGPSNWQNWGAAFSPNGHFIAHGTGSRLCIWEVETGTEHVLFHSVGGGWVRSVSWSPDGSHVAFGGMSGLVSIRNAQTRDVVQERRRRVEGAREELLTETQSIEWIDNGKKILFFAGRDFGIELYDVKENKKWRFAPSKEQHRRVQDRPHAMQQALWCNSRRLVICLDADNAVRFWHLL
ncbi:MAG: hypothetical protein M1819_004565 [Sarea resinae]|nr:MAG: hypothetical protein M1819_004565 [Sarea resinae]